jgi:hypothetical protein
MINAQAAAEQKSKLLIGQNTLMNKGEELLKCYVCNSELIWGGDIDSTDMDDNNIIETTLTCSFCDATVVVFQPTEKED